MIKLILVLVVLTALIVLLDMLTKQPSKQLLNNFGNGGKYQIKRGTVIGSHTITPTLMHENMIKKLDRVLKVYLGKLYNLKKIDYNKFILEKDDLEHKFLDVDCSIVYSEIDTVRKQLHIILSISNTGELCVYNISEGNHTYFKRFYDKNAHHSYSI